MKKQQCEFVEVSDIIPSNWDGWFWSTISEDSPFSLGDNNRSLVCASDFLDHCESCIYIDNVICDNDLDDEPLNEGHRFEHGERGDARHVQHQSRDR